MKVKSYLYGLTLIVLVLFITGCQSKVLEEVETLVAKAEKQGTALEEEVDYESRIEKYTDNAFSIVDEQEIQKTTSTIKSAETKLKEVKDEEVKTKFEKRLNAVEEIAASAKSYNQVLEEGQAFTTSKTDFEKFVQENPFSEELDKKIEEFIALVGKVRESKDKLVGEKLQTEFDTKMISNSDQIIDLANKVLSARNGVNEIEKLVTESARNEDIDAKINDVDVLVKAVTNQPTQDIIGAKQAEVIKPYMAKIAEEKRVAEEKAKAEAQAQANKVATSTSSSSSSGGTSSTSTSGDSSPSSGSTSTSVPSSAQTSTPTYTGLVALAAPVCKKYGYTVKDLSNGDGSQGVCDGAGGGFSRIVVMNSNVELAVDISIAIGCTGSRSEMIESAKQAIANPHTQVKGNGYIAQSDRGAKVSFVW